LPIATRTSGRPANDTTSAPGRSSTAAPRCAAYEVTIARPSTAM
jgi:hypothetical protein